MHKKKIIAYLVVGIIFAFFLGNIFQNWEQIKGVSWRFNLLEFLLLVGVVFSLHFLNSYSWHLVTEAMGFTIPFGENIRIWFIPNVARYLPGKIWQYTGRVYLLSRSGVRKSDGVFAVLFEAIFTLSVAAFTVLLTVLAFNFSLAKGIELVFLGGVVLLPVLVVTVLSNQKLLGLVVYLLQKVTKREVATLVCYKFSLVKLVFLSFVTFVHFLFAGIALFLIARGFIELSLGLLPVFVGVYAVAWILGYISFVTPGGLGVQELSVAGLLSLFLPFSLTSLTAILFRFALMLSEFVVTLVVLWRSKKIT